MADSPQPPAKRPSLDRAALERVLARAAELQATHGEPAEGADAYEGLTEEQLLEVGKEAGLSPQLLRLAMAEERTRVAIASSVGESSPDALRSGVATATRTVAMRAADVLPVIDAWMQRKECLTVKRAMSDRIVWEPGGGVLNAAKRAIGGQGLALAGAHEGSATVVPVDDRHVLVRLDANLAPLRGAAVRDGLAAGTVGGIGAAVAITVAHVFVPVAIVPAVALAAGGWWAGRRRFARALERAQVALEQILDRLERGELSRPSLLNALAAAANNLPRR
jgi:hypothetical protein